METEAELIYKILCGDESAFIELYNKYSKMLIGFIYRHTNDINETSDILQETFVRLLENIKEYNPKGSFKSYIFTIALNIIRDRKRKESFEKKMMPKIYEETISTEDENEDKLKELYNIIENLSEDDKNIILLRLEGYKIEEIAEILGISSRTVNRALKKIIDKLKSKGGFYG
jgi:RNA polymerase sigma-70 factor (ECF subfamily)